MECVLLVPGIMGSRLQNPEGEEIWPPTVAETQFGYGRKAELLREDLVVGDIIRSVWCAKIYQPLVEQFEEIGFSENSGAAKRLEIFPYDWRRDLESTTDLLTHRLSELTTTGATSITLVAHSMGGLICRLALESGRYDNEPWFSKIDSLLTLATPHLGAPLALARILGLDGTLGISGPDFREIANDPRYPSAYQLLPAPGEAACWDVTTPDLQPLDIYDATVAVRLGLDTALLQRSQYVHDTLARGASPAHIRYFFFAGTGHATVTRINVTSSGNKLTTADDAGDGTVPMWSALPHSQQKQLVPGDHSGFFARPTFKAVFYRLLGSTFSTPPLTAAPIIDLSVQALVLAVTDPIDLLLVPSAPTSKIQGAIQLERTVDPATPFSAFGSPLRIHYEGPEVPHLKFALPPIGQPGQYRVTFIGVPGASVPVHFAVVAQ